MTDASATTGKFLIGRWWQMVSIEDLLARAEITDVLCRYAHAIDRGDRELAGGVVEAGK